MFKITESEFKHQIRLRHINEEQIHDKVKGKGKECVNLFNPVYRLANLFQEYITFINYYCSTLSNTTKRIKKDYTKDCQKIAFQRFNDFE